MNLASEIVRQWQEKFNLTIHKAYGMTDTSFLANFSDIGRFDEGGYQVYRRPHQRSDHRLRTERLSDLSRANF